MFMMELKPHLFSLYIEKPFSDVYVFSMLDWLEEDAFG